MNIQCLKHGGQKFAAGISVGETRLEERMMEKLSAEKQSQYNFLGGVIMYVGCSVMAVVFVGLGEYAVTVLMAFMAVLVLFLTGLNALVDILDRI